MPRGRRPPRGAGVQTGTLVPSPGRLRKPSIPTQCRPPREGGSACDPNAARAAIRRPGEPAMTVIADQRPAAPATGPRQAPEPASITIRLLGRFAVSRDGQDIPLRTFGGRLARRLLRLLALRRGTLVSKDL